METLDSTEWDVVIVGTCLQQSLLALALSRSGKKILHIDENEYYGGAEAALSLQEAEAWIDKVNEGSSTAAFFEASIYKLQPAESETSTPLLSFSRAYSLALSPQIVYARSGLLKHLVSSKVYRQLEFLAVGSWWIFSPETNNQDASDTVHNGTGRLLKVPNGREDVFQNHDLDFKAKRALMKFLRFIGEYEELPEVWEAHRARPFSVFLSEQFKISAALQAPLLALALSSAPSKHTTTDYALPRIARHLRSIGVFGAGFGAVIPKWGGLSEISQVGCRASAVGGGVYVLGKGLSDAEITGSEEGGSAARVKLHLKDGEAVTSRWVISEAVHGQAEAFFSKSISIVSSTLKSLFPAIAEESPPPASAVVVFPSGSLSLPAQAREEQDLPPVHVHIHSSDTGECPESQSILYASTQLSGNDGFELLRQAIRALLSSVDEVPLPTTLCSIQYKQRAGASRDVLPSAVSNHIIKFAPTPLDLAFDDSVLDRVKEVWRKVMGDDAGEFLVFDDREAYADDDD